MINKIFCFIRDKKNNWKPATQEMCDSFVIEWKMFPFKQGNSWGYEGERICYKNSEELWRIFRMYLDHNKVKNAITSVIINGTDTRIAFGSGLSCDELNKMETCSDCKSATESQLYSEQLNCEKTGMFVDKNQKACSHIEKKYITDWMPFYNLDKLYKPKGEYYYEFKMKNDETVYGYFLDEETEIQLPYNETETLSPGLYDHLGIGRAINEKDIDKYRLVEKYLNLPKCAYKDYEEGCCNNCPFKNKPGCRENEWDKIQYEEAMDEERMRQEAYEDAMRDELMRNNYDADYGDVRY